MSACRCRSLCCCVLFCQTVVECTIQNCNMRCLVSLCCQLVASCTDPGCSVLPSDCLPGWQICLAVLRCVNSYYPARSVCLQCPCELAVTIISATRVHNCLRSLSCRAGYFSVFALIPGLVESSPCMFKILRQTLITSIATSPYCVTMDVPCKSSYVE
jgi:hypothetical protein